MATGTLYDNPLLFQESVSAVTATNTVQLGTIRWVGGNKYRYMYCPDGTTRIGDGVGLYSAGSGYTITTAITLGDPLCGVCQNTAMTSGTYGWILVDGICKVNTGANSNISSGRNMTILASGTFGDWISNHATSALSAALLYPVVGRSLGSGTGSGVSILAAIHSFNTF